MSWLRELWVHLGTVAGSSSQSGVIVGVAAVALLLLGTVKEFFTKLASTFYVRFIIVNPALASAILIVAAWSAWSPRWPALFGLGALVVVWLMKRLRIAVLNRWVLRFRAEHVALATIIVVFALLQALDMDLRYQAFAQRKSTMTIAVLVPEFNAMGNNSEPNSTAAHLSAALSSVQNAVRIFPDTEVTQNDVATHLATLRPLDPGSGKLLSDYDDQILYPIDIEIVSSIENVEQRLYRLEFSSFWLDSSGQLFPGPKQFSTVSHLTTNDADILSWLAAVSTVDVVLAKRHRDGKSVITEGAIWNSLARGIVKLIRNQSAAYLPQNLDVQTIKQRVGHCLDSACSDAVAAPFGTSKKIHALFDSFSDAGAIDGGARTAGDEFEERLRTVQPYSAGDYP